MNEKSNDVKPDLIPGRNPVSEAVRSNRPIDKILVASGEKSGAIVGILAKAREKQIPVKEVSKTKLDMISGNAVHQGIIAFAAVKEYSTVEDILEYAQNKMKRRLLLFLTKLRILIIWERLSVLPNVPAFTELLFPNEGAQASAILWAKRQPALLNICALHV